MPSPASSPSKASTATTKKTAVPKIKVNAKSKVTKNNLQARKKRKANNDFNEGSLTEGEATANQMSSHSRAINEVETTEPILADKRKIDEMLVFHEDKDSHNKIKVEEPFNFDGDLSDSESSFSSIFVSIACALLEVCNMSW